MAVIKARLDFVRSVISRDATKQSTLSRCDPYISVVIAGRNDGYGVDFLGRLRMFMRSLDHQVRNHPGLIELIIVEWNPLADRESMQQVIDIPKHYPVRIITVPPETHDKIGANYPVLEFYAKNTGARRARGAFVLTTNPDIIFSQEMIDRLAQRDLDPYCFYRTDRFDFKGDGIEIVDIEDLSQWILPYIFVGHVTEYSLSASIPRPQDLELKRLDQLPQSKWSATTVHSNGAGDFILASREAFDTVGGLVESTTQRWHIDSYSVMRFYRLGFDPVVFTAPHCIFHTDHPRSGMDQDVTQSSAQDAVMATINHDWGLKDHDLPEWSSR